MRLSELLNSLYSYEIKGAQQFNPSITSIEMDSRNVSCGSLFICIKGYTVDGHDFVNQAVENGAVAIISEKAMDINVPVVIVNDTVRAMAILANEFYGHPTKQLNLIGVTGTNGKTTTTHLIDEILKAHKKSTGLIGTMYMKYNDQQIDVNNTTPESLLLQRTFHHMVQSGVEVATMEVSSHALQLGRVRGCDYDIAVFTNLTQDHLDYHGTMDAYRNAKGLLFSQLGNTYTAKKYAILNADDAASQAYENITSAQIIKYGIDNSCNVWAKNIKITSQGTSFDLEAFEHRSHVNLKMVGKFSVYNALAAIATCLVYGIPYETIIHTLQLQHGVSGRFEVVDEGQPFTVIVDYAHTPDSLDNVINTIKEFVKGNIIVVVGCGGDRDKTKRPLMAKIASEQADYVVLTSDNPRTEDPDEIIKEMEKGLVESSQFISIVNRKDAITHAVKLAKEEDVILIAGKGHETYQIIGKEKTHFDDRLVAREAIKELLKS